MGVELTIILEAGEDGFWVASIPEIPGAFSQGATREEARANVLEALEELMAARRELALKDLSSKDSFESLALRS